MKKYTKEYISKTVDHVVNVFLRHGSKGAAFKRAYGKFEEVLETHKRNTLISFLDKPVTLTGVLQRRGDGDRGNLNLVSPCWINGIKVEHLHVYDEVIDEADIDYETGCLIASSMKIYRYGRNKRHLEKQGLGVKPQSCPVWQDRNEIV